ncbi:MAG: hypothetical protein ACW98W_14900 [Candidatus Hodarchaeales archaeon]|jgi:hypothetical protein
MSNLFASYLGQVYGDRYTRDKRKEIDPIATAAEKKRFDRTQRNLDRLAVGAGALSTAHNFTRNLTEGKFRPISALGSGQAAYQGIKGTLNPVFAGIDDYRIKRRIRRELSPRSGSPTASKTYVEPATEYARVDPTLFSEPERVGRTQAPVASSTYVEPAAEFRTVDPAMLSEERQINPIRTPSPQEQRLVGVTPQQRVFTQRFAGGPVKVIPKAEPTPEHKMTERQVKVLAPTAPTAPTTQSNLNQFTEKDMVRIINQDDTEDAREEKRLNAQNLDGSKQIQGNV